MQKMKADGGQKCKLKSFKREGQRHLSSKSILLLELTYTSFIYYSWYTSATWLVSRENTLLMQTIKWQKCILFTEGNSSQMQNRRLPYSFHPEADGKEWMESFIKVFHLTTQISKFVRSLCYECIVLGLFLHFVCKISFHLIPSLGTTHQHRDNNNRSKIENRELNYTIIKTFFERINNK